MTIYEMYTDLIARGFLAPNHSDETQQMLPSHDTSCTEFETWVYLEVVSGATRRAELGGDPSRD